MSAAKQHYLVLGSSGLIGSDLVRLLTEQGHTVTEFDILRSPEEDLRIHNNKKLIAAVAKADFIYFLAFDVGGSKYLKDYQHSFTFIDNNLKIMVNTFEILKASAKPFIFASSQMANMSHSPYGALKLVGDQMTAALGGLITKFWNVYGVESDPEKTHVITDFIQMARQGAIKMRTTGDEERQFLHVRDCSECLYMFAERYEEFVQEKVIHVTSFEWVKVKDIAAIINSVIPATIVVGEATDSVQGQKNPPSEFVLKHWKPKITLEEGIRMLISL